MNIGVTTINNIIADIKSAIIIGISMKLKYLFWKSSYIYKYKLN